MVGEAAAIGDVMTGALGARAVEPRAGEAYDATHAHPADCLNCGTALQGDYCHSCGQHAHLHRSVGAIWHDIAHGVLHFEGKTFRTLPLLAWRPGELTRRYIDGERARFVSPMALFLFGIFTMFAVIQALGGSLHTPTLSAEAQAETRTEMTRSIAANDESIRLMTVEKAALAERGASTAAIDRRIASVEEENRRTRIIMNEILGTGTTNADPFGQAPPTETGWKRLDKGIAKFRANPNLALYKMQTNAYKFSWALIPISVPFVWLMFAWRRRFHVYDHAVFVTYSLGFMTLMGVVLTIAWAVGLSSEVAWSIALLLPPVHMYRQLRGTYGLRRFNAFMRTIALATFAVVAMVIFFLLLLAMGALG
ncbi:hypothetical protein GGR88_002678 [Sphingomonas jejuensis]|uniref:DUF3667 domain-containing protein n=1 Tax=Sphingomonas jejuensis TaxID=904715 RepID=A0ABX0XPH9_9SPHN|nr:DUF3667 domain-containing protein [Sphingomonas jejuensis]NJC35164.1 hypothetical protein [Sphingomonas jejuensis]